MSALLVLGLVSLALFILSVPIAFALGLSCLLVMVIWPTTPFILVVQQILGGMDSFPLLAVPFFLLAAGIMNQGGITNRLIKVFDALLGRARGSLAMVDISVNMFLAGISGSGVADCTATGAVLIPAMKRSGYSGAFAAALTSVAAVCGPIIPPSIAMVIYGMVARVSILELFLAGYLPGILLALLLMGYVWLIAKRRGFPTTPKVGLRETAARMKASFWALVMPVLLVAGIILGVFTVTELGSVLCFYALLVSWVIYREFSLRDLPRLLRQVALDSANVIFIVGVSSLFAYLLTIHQVPDLIQAAVLAITDNKIVLLLIINVVFLVAGMFIDSTPATLILVPIFLPVCQTFGVDPAHLGVVVVFNLCIGLVTPPVALNLYITSRISGAPIRDIIVELLPMFAILCGVLAFITFTPDAILWLPRQLGYAH